MSNSKPASLAKALADEVAKRYPPAIANNPVQVVSPQRLAAILEEVFLSAEPLAEENALGWYKRTRLGRRFRRELNELGYDRNFVDKAADNLARHLRGLAVIMS